MMEKVRVLTPRPATPEVCIPLVRDLADRVLATAPVPVPTDVPVGLGFPAVVVAGSPRTAAHVDRSWIGYPLAPSLQRAMGRPVAIDNDADAAGAAEMRFGAGAGVPGMVVMVTLGTGIGTSLFVDGHHVPNTELGHLSMRGRDAEFWASGAARKRRNLGWDRWAEALDEYLRILEKLLHPDLVILGGGVSKHAHEYLHRLRCAAPVVAAHLRNDAGMVGAALRTAPAPER